SNSKPISDTKISLTAENVTLDDLAKQIGKLTGATIRASEPIQERRVTVIVLDKRASDVLDSVCETVGLTWDYRSDGTILIGRRVVRRPQRVAEVPQALHAALPGDVRTYLGLDGWAKMGSPEKWAAAMKGERGPQMDEVRTSLQQVIN